MSQLQDFINLCPAIPFSAAFHFASRNNLKASLIGSAIPFSATPHFTSGTNQLSPNAVCMEQQFVLELTA
jgi:hypothetical protein